MVTEQHLIEAEVFLMETPCVGPVGSWDESIQAIASLIAEAERRGADTGA